MEENIMTKTIDDLAQRWLHRPEKAGEAESRVFRSAIERKALSRDVNLAYAEKTTVGQRLADTIALVGGSWGFIISFLAFLLAWALLNAWLLGRNSFDPYPFIFLNLILSMLAAVQAPIIMMSQNRQAARDRLDAAHDYEINLKAEIEIMALHEKLDELRHREIVAVHDLVKEIAARVGRIETGLAGAAPADAGAKRVSARPAPRRRGRGSAE
jgi:uncharacterized membrane protein